MLMQDQFHSGERIAKVHVPLLVIHCERDPAIAIRFGRRLFALANEPKRFVSFPDGGHFDLDAYGASAAARQFINEYRRSWLGVPLSVDISFGSIATNAIAPAYRAASAVSRNQTFVVLGNVHPKRARRAGAVRDPVGT